MEHCVLFSFSLSLLDLGGVEGGCFFFSPKQKPKNLSSTRTHQQVIANLNQRFHRLEQNTLSAKDHKLKPHTMPPKQDSFLQKKQSILNSNIDLSPKGSIDALCIPIIKLINDNSDDMVTTSSCSGRLSVFVEGVKAKPQTKQLENTAPKAAAEQSSQSPEEAVTSALLEYKLGGKGDGGEWLYITHNVDEVTGWLQKVQSSKRTIRFLSDDKETETDNIDMTTKRLILYKFEPLILHIKCRNFETASRLYNVAMGCGFRESGIGSNFNVALRINIKLDVPIGYLNEADGSLQLIVPEVMLKNVMDPLTILKFKENEAKLNELYNKINTEIIQKNTNDQASIGSSPRESSIYAQETKEERRIRKKQEGLAKQLELAKLKKEQHFEQHEEPTSAEQNT